jgi:argininosuccinate synthase
MDPNIRIIAPWREWDLNSRSALMEFAQKHGIKVPTTRAKPYSIDRNLLHISFEGGLLEDPWTQPPEDMYTLTTSPKDAPGEPEVIEITFKQGDPVAINDKHLSPVLLLKELNRLAGGHGIGRADIVENRFVGIKSRGVYETPGGTVLRAAHIAMESITMDREVMHFRDSIITKYSELVYYGYWFSPEMRLLQDMIDQTQKNVTGTVRLELYKGNCRILGRKSDESIYNEDFATFEDDSVYNQKDAEGFIRLNALRLRIAKMMEK